MNPKALMENTNGPPIRQRIRDLPNGWRIRESYGDTPNGIQRFDIHKGVAGGKGWQDAFWRDKETGQVMFLKDTDGNPTLAEVGISRWAGKGPAVPAERGCFECHRGIGMATAADPKFEEFQAALLTQLIAVHGDWGRKPTQPVPTPVVQGPAGPAGPKGDKGDPGQITADQLRLIILEVTKSIKEELKSGDYKGGKGDKGDDGDDGKTPTNAELLVLIRQVIKENEVALKGKDGQNGKAGTLRLILKWEGDDKPFAELGPYEPGTVTVPFKKSFFTKEESAK